MFLNKACPCREHINNNDNNKNNKRKWKKNKKQKQTNKQKKNVWTYIGGIKGFNEMKSSRLLNPKNVLSKLE